MPEYTFENTVNGELVEITMSIAERAQYLVDNPQMQQIFIGKGNGFIAGIGHKPDEGFRDILREIKARHPGSNIDTF